MNVLSGYWKPVFLAGAICCALAGCGGGTDDTVATALPLPPDPVGDTSAYNGPGSKWDVELDDDGQFLITRRPDVGADTDLTVAGSYTRSSLGFVLLSVESASGENAPEIGDVAWAVEAPGYALMLYTDGDMFIPMIDAGSCPESDMLSNWVIARKRLDADPTEADGDYFGEFAFDAASGVASLPSRFALASGFPNVGAAALEASDCADGVATVSDAVMYLTDNGGALVHSNIDEPDDSSVIFALAQKQLSGISALDGEYAGILFDASGSDGERVVPVVAACSNGLCDGNFVTDVTLGTVDESFGLDLFGSINGPVPGFVTGSVSDGAGATGSIACAADEDVLGSGRSMFSCVGQAPGNNSRLFNVILVAN